MISSTLENGVDDYLSKYNFNISVDRKSLFFQNIHKELTLFDINL